MYYVVNKPIGYVCSSRDSHNDLLVTSLVPAKPRVVSVGRLDKDSSGLVILTNDGELVHHLTHPKFMTEKVYEVDLMRSVTGELVRRLKKGIPLEEGIAAVDRVEQLGPSRLRISNHQGWKRQIRRMIGGCDNAVVALRRIAEGKVRLGTLALGESRKLFRSDIME